MNTTRLNRLVQAYRQTKAMIGDANRGKALPGPALRMCHKVRRAVLKEMQRVVKYLQQNRCCHTQENKQ